MMAAVDDFLAEDGDARPSGSGAADDAVAPHATEPDQPARKWDVFISHASEDKGTVARPLADLLRARGLEVWLDENELKLGDSLREKIDHGLSNSRYGVVILSKSFFGKDWPIKELNGLASLEVNGRKVILPVWHDVDRAYVSKYSPMLADRMAASTAKGLEAVADDIMNVVVDSAI